MTGRAEKLRLMVATVGRLYVPERVHAVQIATKKLRYVVEIATGTREVDDAATVSRLKRVQQTLGRLHDLKVVRRLMRSIELPTERHQMWVGQFQTLDDHVEAECRRLHSRFVTGQPMLIRASDEARELAARISHRAGRGRSGGRILKMSLGAPADRSVSRRQ